MSTAVVAVVVTAVSTGGGCGGSGQTAKSIGIDGSSTVAPLTEAAADLFREHNPGIQITVGTSGTGGGFEKFCRGETDISDASRSITQAEREACTRAGIDYVDFQVANDAVTVIVNKENAWATCLTAAQLRRIWDVRSPIENWNQVDPKFPDEPLLLFGPGTDSGTFDYFTSAINGKGGRSRTDYQASEDDNVIIAGVEGSRGGLGYIGYGYFEENTDRLRALAVDDGDGCVAPSVGSVQDGSYRPLARPLFIYVKRTSLARPALVDFVDYYVENSTAIARQALFIPLTSAQVAVNQKALADVVASGRPSTPAPGRS
ncbi:phosphate ABC transporter substrate-binding protein [Pseudofrankia sp. BMG5.36]|nr:phosphate ABC transporter substrate-binding protein [Pseudofrankia sp. BMG5.36]